MKNLLKKFGIEGLLAVLALAFACVSMWGCSDEVSFEWQGRGNAKVVGFVDDSLVIVGDYLFWHETTERWNGEYLEDDGTANPRLCTYNYRVQENGPRWCDSIVEENASGWFSGQLTDSIIWGGSLTGSFKMWKIGEQPHIINPKISYDNCSVEFKTKSVKQWLDGRFIALGDKSLNAGGDSCQCAVLDTLSGMLTYKRLDKDLEWIKVCDDVRAWGKDVYCSASGEHPLEGHILKNNIDTLSSPLIFSRGIFWGKMIELRASICRLEAKAIICLNPDFTWREPLKFYQNDEVVVDLE